MEALTPYQQTAVQIFKASSKIATAEQLAEFRLAKTADGRFVNERYNSKDELSRISWLGDQMFGLSALTHTTLTASVVAADVLAIDDEIMRTPALREMTLVEMQDAFRSGVFREYGEYYGLSAVSIIGFLNGFIKSEKKQTASAIIFKDEKRKEQEANERFYKELYAAQQRGDIELPDFSHMRINGAQKKKTITPEESAAHREKVRQQAAEILKQHKEESHD